ncbi:MAG: hypothetical protein ACRD0A_14650 [Acidimicrobiales bacterium]
MLAKSGEVARAAPQGVERVVELDDRVFWKVKIDRWRGALWTRTDEAWLVAAGYRRAGDADDFYNELGQAARRWRADYNRANTPALATDTFTGPLLPTADDRDRIVLEDALRVVDDLRAELRDLTAQSAESGVEARGEAAGCELGVLVRRSELGEVYVSVRIVARTPDVIDIHALVLDSMPAVADRNGWFMEPMPERDPGPGEIGWSNILDEQSLDEFLAARDG